MHYVYEEMYITGSQLKSGISEAKAFAEFGTRCGLQQYMKLSGLLEQNRKKWFEKFTGNIKAGNGRGI